MSETTELVRVERRDDGVAVVRLDNPKVNALSSTLLAQLEVVAKDLTADPPGAVAPVSGRAAPVSAPASVYRMKTGRSESVTSPSVAERTPSVVPSCGTTSVPAGPR